MTTVSVPTTLDNQPTIEVSAESSLTKNQQAALPVSPEDELAAVHDADGHPIIFGFSPDGDFYVVHRDPGGPTGWTQVDLSDSLKAYGTPTTFAAGQLPGGAITLAAAVQRGSDPSTEDVFIAGALSPNLSQTDWSQLEDQWVKAAAPRTGVSVDSLYVGPQDDGQGFGLPVLAVSLDDDTPDAVNEYVVQADVNVDSGRITWSYAAFPTPSSKAQLLDYALGSISDLGTDPGLYLLYEGVDGEPWLVFKTLPNEYGRSYDRQLIAPDGAAVLQTTPGRDGTTGLFVGGTDGVHWFRPDNQGKEATSTTIASGTSIPDVRPDGLIVREDQTEDGTIAVWALSGETLYYLHSQDDGTWSDPIPFETGVARIAPLRNQKKYANELVYIGTDLQSDQVLHYMWQDPTTTLWNRDQIPLHSTGNVLHFSCYTTNLVVEDADGGPLHDVTFELTAGSWQRVIVNGVTHIVDRDAPVEVSPDPTGTLTIIQKVDDLSTPLYHLRGGFFEGALEVDPAHKVYDALRKVQSPDDIPVLPETLPKGVSKTQVSTAVQNLMKLHPSGGHPVKAITLKDPSADPRQAVVTKHLAADAPAEFAVGSTVASGPVGDLDTSIREIGGDVLQFLETVVDDVTDFVVKVGDEVVTFVATIGEEVAHFVVNTVQEVYRAITWIFKRLKVAFEDVLKWLGELIGWDEIWKTHKVLAALLTSGLDYSVDRVDTVLEGWKNDVDHFFDRIDHDIKNLVVPTDVAGTKPHSTLQTGPGADARKHVHSPRANWSAYQMKHGGMLNGTTAAVGVSDPFTQFVQDVLVPTITEVADDLEKDLSDLSHLLKEGATVQNVVDLASDLIDTVIQPIKKLVHGLISFMEDLLGDVQQALEDPMDIPFLSAFYEWLTGLMGEEEELTPINAVALLVAVPYTEVARLTTGKAPFADGTHGLDDPEIFHHVVDGGASSGPVAAPHAASFAASSQATPPSAARNVSAMNNEAAPEAKVANYYVHLGGAAAAITGLISGILGTIVAFLDAGGEKGDKGTINVASKFLIGLALLRYACSFPIRRSGMSTGAYVTRVVAWVLGALGAIIVPIVAQLDPKGKVSKSVSAFVNAVLLIVLLVADGLGGEDAVTWVLDIGSNLGGTTKDAGLVFKESEYAVIAIALGAFASYASAIGGFGKALATEMDEVVYLVNVGGTS